MIMMLALFGFGWAAWAKEPAADAYDDDLVSVKLVPR